MQFKANVTKQDLHTYIHTYIHASTTSVSIPEPCQMPKRFSEITSEAVRPCTLVDWI